LPIDTFTVPAGTIIEGLTVPSASLFVRKFAPN